jgi:transposase
MNRVFCGIDLGTRSSSICILKREKAVIHRWSGLNRKLEEALKGYADDLLCIVEASPLAESVCRRVEALKARIEIVDSRHTKSVLHGRKKTDRIDAETLAELALLGWYKPIHRKDGTFREQRTILGGRAAMVETATRLKNTIRGLLKANGLVLPTGGDGAVFEKGVNEAVQKLPLATRGAINDLLRPLEISGTHFDFGPQAEARLSAEA